MEQQVLQANQDQLVPSVNQDLRGRGELTAEQDSLELLVFLALLDP